LWTYQKHKYSEAQSQAYYVEQWVKYCQKPLILTKKIGNKMLNNLKNVSLLNEKGIENE